MSFPIPVRYELTEELNNTRVVYNNGETLDMIPAERCINIRDMVIGGSVVWNQLGNLDAWTGFRVIAVESNTKYTVTVTVDALASLKYLYRKTIKDHKYLFTAIVNIPEGGDHGFYVGDWNGTQANNYSKRMLVNSVTPVGSRIVFMCNANYDASYFRIQWGTTVPKDYSVELEKPMFFDLTTMFGSTIADYIYQLEQNTAGAGVAFFRKLFPNDYYEYNTGTNKTIALIPQS